MSAALWTFFWLKTRSSYPLHPVTDLFDWQNTSSHSICGNCWDHYCRVVDWGILSLTWYPVITEALVSKLTPCNNNSLKESSLHWIQKQSSIWGSLVFLRVSGKAGTQSQNNKVPATLYCRQWWNRQPQIYGKATTKLIRSKAATQLMNSIQFMTQKKTGKCSSGAWSCK